LANFEGVAEIIRDYQKSIGPWDDNEAEPGSMMEYMASSGVRAEMEIARRTAICRKTDCGPLENEIVRLRAQIRTLEEGNGAQIKTPEAERPKRLISRPRSLIKRPSTMKITKVFGAYTTRGWARTSRRLNREKVM
jgi:hypothetical protein